MKLADLAELMGKTIPEVEAMLREQEIVEVDLTEKKQREDRENGRILVLN